MRPNRLLAIVGISWLLMSGCQATTIVNPVSDEESSQIDDRLLGTYTGVVDSLPSGKPQAQKRVVIRRSKTHPNAHEAVFRELNGNNMEQNYRWHFWTTRLGSLRVASVPASFGSNFTVMNFTTDEQGTVVPVDSPRLYSILAYDLLPNGDLYILQVNYKFITEAIERGELSGELTLRLPSHPDLDETKRREGGYSKVRVTASTEELAKFFRKHQFAAFQPKSTATLVYRRIK